MDTFTNGLSQGDFTLLNVLHNGSMQNIITLIGSLGVVMWIQQAHLSVSVEGFSALI